MVSRELYPFADHALDRGGLRYHYVDEGQGEPIVLVHGNPTWSFFYRDLIQTLRDEYRMVAPDHIGCGLSDKPDDSRYSYRLASRVDDLAALIDHVAPGRPITLVVHDWGGMIGLAWAVRHPQRLARLVVLNTAAFFPPPRQEIALADRHRPQHAPWCCTRPRLQRLLCRTGALLLRQAAAPSGPGGLSGTV